MEWGFLGFAEAMKSNLEDFSGPSIMTPNLSGKKSMKSLNQGSKASIMSLNRVGGANMMFSKLDSRSTMKSPQSGGGRSAPLSNPAGGNSSTSLVPEDTAELGGARPCSGSGEAGLTGSVSVPTGIAGEHINAGMAFRKHSRTLRSLNRAIRKHN